MKLALTVFGVLSILAGGVFFLQGLNILPGSFMTGDPQWTISGGFLILIGVVLLILANRRK